MNILIHLFISFLLVSLGWIIAEISNTYAGKKEDGTKKLISFTGIIVTQKDLQRLFLGVFIGIAFSIIKGYVPIGLESNGEHRITYLIIGFAPSLILYWVNRKIDKKFNK